MNFFFHISFCLKNFYFCKIGTYLFKRLVYESRRKGKGTLRPKVRTNYKDLSNVNYSFLFDLLL